MSLACIGSEAQRPLPDSRTARRIGGTILEDLFRGHAALSVSGRESAVQALAELDDLVGVAVGPTLARAG